MKPVYLYVKRHRDTGLLYFGKTTRKDPEKYRGSGMYWQRHLKMHGNTVETIFVEKFVDLTLLQEFAIFFSEFYEIVDSPRWANLTAETGVDGFPAGGKMPVRSIDHCAKLAATRNGKKWTDDARKAQSLRKMGTTASSETKKKMSDSRSGAKNHNALTWEITDPIGNKYRITGLRHWCRENGYSFYQVYNSTGGWSANTSETGCNTKNGK